MATSMFITNDMKGILEYLCSTHMLNTCIITGYSIFIWMICVFISNFLMSSVIRLSVGHVVYRTCLSYYDLKKDQMLQQISYVLIVIFWTNILGYYYISLVLLDLHKFISADDLKICLKHGLLLLKKHNALYDPSRTSLSLMRLFKKGPPKQHLISYWGLLKKAYLGIKTFNNPDGIGIFNINSQKQYLRASITFAITAIYLQIVVSCLHILITSNTYLFITTMYVLLKIKGETSRKNKDKNPAILTMKTQ